MMGKAKKARMIMVSTLSMIMLFGSSVYAKELNNSRNSNWVEINKYVTERYSQLSEVEQTELAEEIYQENLNYYYKGSDYSSGDLVFFSY